MENLSLCEPSMAAELGCITPFFNYPPDIRRAIYTTNSVESLNRSLRKIIKTRGGFPNEEAALKLLFLALRQAAKKWTMPIFHWREALNHFTILWPERMRPWKELRNDKAESFYIDGRGKGYGPLPRTPSPKPTTTAKPRATKPRATKPRTKSRSFTQKT